MSETFELAPKIVFIRLQSLKNRIFSVCAPPPQYVMRPPVTEHVPLHSKSLCKVWHVRLGVQIICAHYAGGAQTEKIKKSLYR